MSPATKEKKARETLTLRDSVDLLAGINQAIEDHVDEIELNEGELPEWMQQMLDEIDAAMADRVDALAFKIDQFTGFATTAKATKDRAARREKVWNNAIKGMKAYGLYQVQRNGGQPLKGVTASLRLQNNSAASVECSLTQDDLLEASDCALVGPGVSNHPLGRYITVTPVCTLDKRALGDAYQARRAVLQEDAQLITVTDEIPQNIRDRFGLDDLERGETELAIATNDAVEHMRAMYVFDNLATEFPGVTVTRGCHLRID